MASKKRRALPSIGELRKLVAQARSQGVIPESSNDSLIPDILSKAIDHYDEEDLDEDIEDDDMEDDVWEDEDEFTLVPSNAKDALSFQEVPFESWKYAADAARTMFPRSIKHAKNISKVEVDKIYANGFIAGKLISEKQFYNVFFNVTGVDTRVPAGCNCELSEGKNPCPHALSFTTYVATQLSSRNSTLSKRILAKDWDQGQPDVTLYEPDEWNDFSQYLDKLVRTPKPPGEELDAIHYSQNLEVVRLAWNFSTSFNSITATPLRQALSKRGDKWNKGVRISLAESLQSNIQKSAVDEYLLRHYPSSEYGSEFSEFLSLLARHSIGGDNIYFNSDPCTVDYLEPIVGVIEHPSFLTFGFLASSEHCTVYFSRTEEQCYEFDFKSNTLRASFSSEQDIKAIYPLVQSKTKVPIKHKAAFYEKAKKIQLSANLILPEDIGGKIVPLSAKPVVILRSTKDGKLDYAFRIRDELGILRMPACGPLIVPGVRDGLPIQYKRSCKAEVEMVRQIRISIAPDSIENEATIFDFEKIIAFMDALDQRKDEIEILWDKTSEQAVQVLGTLQQDNVRVSIEKKRDWFSLEGTCQIGKASLDISALLQSLRALQSGDIKGDFVKLGNQGWARISKELRTKLRQLDDSVNLERKQIRFDSTSAFALRSLQDEFAITSSKSWKDCLQRLEKAEKLDPKLPNGLKAELRQYQLEGYCWLRRLAEWGVGGILADDMGLGKTLQTLGVLLDRSSAGPSLVIAPTSVGFNWLREANKFTPELNASLYRESDRSTMLENLKPGDLVICSYGLALRDAELLEKVEWNSLVLDEAQAIKNGRSKTSQAIEQFKADWILALTGTPVENHLGELWSLFKIVSPGVFGGWEQFRDRFAAPIEKYNDEDRKNALRQRLKPFVLRRTKKEVLKDLPPRTEMNLVVELSPAERQLYESVRQSALGEIDSLAKLPDIDDQRFKLLALLTRLRQIACNPKIVHETWSEGSAKMDQLIEKLLQLREEGHRVLVFSQFVQHLGLIRENLDKEQITYQYLDGQTPAAKRQEEVDKFQNGDATVFLISLKAGGTGLNLTAADYVIHMDPWWNPAVEDQATDRAHRIGQDKPVMVYRIIAQGTIEEEILKLHDSKRDLVAGVLDGSHTAAKLSTEDLISMIRG